MMLTEQEAKERTCCAAITPIDAELRIVNCMASGCMAWRWGPEPPNQRCLLRDADGRADLQTTAEPPRPKTVPAAWHWRPAEPDDDIPAGWWESDADADARRTGYCGLAGDPEA